MLYDSATCPCDSHAEHARAMEIAPSNVAGAMLRGDQRRKTYPSEELLDSHSCGRPPDSNPWNRGFLYKENPALDAGIIFILELLRINSLLS